MAHSPTAPETAEGFDASGIFRKVTLRLMPLLFILYVFAYLDRVNVGYAALGIRRELHFSDTVYGTGAGLFFLSYAICEIPSNLILLRLGPRRWIAAMMIAWGIISTSMPLVHAPWSFYALRFLLGVAEAGFFPGILLYLTAWFPQALRARAVAWFMTATAISGIVGGPVSSLLLRLDGVAGVSGWKWLFVAEGLPSVVLGAVVFFTLTDRPALATWLSADERAWLADTIARDRSVVTARHALTLKDVFRNTVLWRLSFIYFSTSVSVYSVSLWLPVVLKNLSGAKDSTVLVLTGVPYLLAVFAMVIIARSSDVRGERRMHLAACLFAIALGYGLSGWIANPALSIAALFIATAGTWGAFGPFWALPTTVLGGTAAAGGIAFINSIGALGGFCGPSLMGRVSDLTHSFRGALLSISGLLLLAMFVSLSLPRQSEAEMRR